MQASSLAGDPTRFLELDGLRGIAILLVMLFHFTIAEPITFLDVVVLKVARYGWSGVDLFFVLSGFLITGILINAKGHAHFFRNFYIRRALRILPLYYAFVLALLFLYPIVGRHNVRAEAELLKQDQWWIWTHTVNWLVAHTKSWATPLMTGGILVAFYRRAILFVLAADDLLLPATTAL